MSDKKLDRFGKYLLLDHLLDGGMNRIFRARYLGDTASKICAVKVVLPQYSQDPQFKTMFMDEIKVTFGLLHPNIVQTYDYGTHKGQLYVAMEYCDGRNLKEYLDKLKERKFVFPVEISVYIGTQICQGLHYAHTLSDKLTGKEMNIIHRDISPHNIMLTYDGSIKIIDFGIAKAETNSEATQAGTIKGKLSYLAPEYLEGSDLDARYDQFAVGITLWEMLCNRKLFKAPNDIAVLKKIQECNVPRPSSINPNVSIELDEIILKSLSKNPADRFENMDMFNRSLIKFLYSKYPDFNATDLSYFAKELFKEDIQKDREKLFDFGKIELGPYIDDMKAEANGELREESDKGENNQDNNSESDNQSKINKKTVFDWGFSDEEKEERTKNGTRILNKKKVRKALGAKSPQADLAIDETNLGLDIDQPNVANRVNRKKIEKPSSPINKIKPRLNTATQGTSSPKVSTRNTSKPKNIIEPPKEKKSSSMKNIFAASVVLIAVVGFFFKDKISNKPRSIATIGKDEESSVSSENKKENSKNNEKIIKKIGKIEFTNFDKFKQKVFLNGVKVEVDVIGVLENIPYGDHYLRIEERGRQHFVEIISVNEGSNGQKIKIPNMKKVNYGFLRMGNNCANGEIEFNLFGEKRIETVPFTYDEGVTFPVLEEGKYTIFFKSTETDLKKKIEFNLQREDDIVDLCSLIFE